MRPPTQTALLGFAKQAFPGFVHLLLRVLILLCAMVELKAGHALYAG
jgi:hypothetical protein